MLFSWFQNRRRRKLLQTSWPAEWLSTLESRVRLAQRLPARYHVKWKNDTRILMAEKFWEGCNGLVVTDEMKLIISLHAAYLLVGMDADMHRYFDRVPSILIYPHAFHTAKPDDTGDENFVADSPAEGQAVYRGPVILAWDEVLDDLVKHDQVNNVVIHEFAHQLDFLDNSVDGIPPLANFRDRGRWKTVMNEAMEVHRNRLDRRLKLFFPPAAGENVTEFFAYASEAFFCQPRELKSIHAEVYELLSAFYCVDTASW
jgi:Mlc titration factor MtfA (ptsG expression regulator)